MSGLVRRWAQAAFDVASAQGAVDAVGQDLAQIAEVLNDADLRALVQRPELSTSLRDRLTLGLSRDRHPLTGNLLRALAARRRLALLTELPKAFEALVLASRGEVRGVVETSHPLDEAAMATLGRAAEQLSGQKVVLDVRQNPALIGGVRLRVGNTLWDGSVSARLERLRQQLLEAPLAGS